MDQSCWCSEIFHHLECITPVVNNGIISQPQLVSRISEPSTVSLLDTDSASEFPGQESSSIGRKADDERFLWRFSTCEYLRCLWKCGPGALLGAATLYHLWSYGAPFNLEKSLRISTCVRWFLTDGSYHGKSPQKTTNFGEYFLCLKPATVYKLNLRWRLEKPGFRGIAPVRKILMKPAMKNE